MVLARALYSEEHWEIQLRTTMPEGVRQAKAVFLWAADRSVTQLLRSPIIPSPHYSQRGRRCQSTWPRRQVLLVFVERLEIGAQHRDRGLAGDLACPRRVWGMVRVVAGVRVGVLGDLPHNRGRTVGDGLWGDRARVSTGHPSTSPGAGAGALANRAPVAWGA
jgi:hypothetical protein